jgi:hypothetical protein
LEHERAPPAPAAGVAPCRAWARTRKATARTPCWRAAPAPAPARAPPTTEDLGGHRDHLLLVTGAAALRRASGDVEAVHPLRVRPLSLHGGAARGRRLAGRAGGGGPSCPALTRRTLTAAGGRRRGRRRCWPPPPRGGGIRRGPWRGALLARRSRGGDLEVEIVRLVALGTGARRRWMR